MKEPYTKTISPVGQWALLVGCLALSILCVTTQRIEVAIVLLGIVLVLFRSSDRFFWVAWSSALLASVVAVAVSAFALGASGSVGFLQGPTVSWLAVAIVLAGHGIAHGRRWRRATTTAPVHEGDCDMQETFDLSCEVEMLCGTDLHESVSSKMQTASRESVATNYRLSALDIEELLGSIRNAGKFDDVQIRLVHDVLKQAVFQPNADCADLLLPGSVVGKYTIESLLNQGGGGRVYAARHEEHEQIVALKVLKSRKLNSRFRREMSLVQKLAHPNIVVAYEVDEHEGVPFIAMELLAGADLHAHVRDHGPVPYDTTLNWILQAARALAHADERGLTHRDVKPGNLILHRDNVLKLTDLGLAVLKSHDCNDSSEFITHDAAVVGTLEFMAPEQAKSLASADARSDIFGLGATWFFLLEGKSHLRGKSLKEQLGALLVERSFLSLTDGLMPWNARAVLDRMVAYDPADRFQTWDELIEALSSLAGNTDSNESPCINVLLIEDNEDDVVLTTRLLSKMNQSVSIHEANTLRQAKELLQGDIKFDLVLLDLQLPDSFGLGTVHAVRDCDPDTPVVVLSGYADASTGQACIAAGASAFTSKDALSVHELERTIFVTRSRCEASAASSFEMSDSLS
ncbi:MAG: protein kinase [Pirellulaceae bacterium]